MSSEHDPNEVAGMLGIKPSTLHKWSQEFAPLLGVTIAASDLLCVATTNASDIALLCHGAVCIATEQEVRFIDNVYESFRITMHFTVYSYTKILSQM